MEEVVLLLGSNGARRVKRLREGIAAMAADVTLDAVSRIHAGAPKGRSGQPWFLNVAVRGRTSLSPEDLLGSAKRAEAGCGRTSGPRWGPRELDVDIVLMGTRFVRLPHLAIPHAGLAGRRFCLLPVAEIAPEWPVPPRGLTVRDLLDACDDPLEVFPL